MPRAGRFLLRECDLAALRPCPLADEASKGVAPSVRITYAGDGGGESERGH